MDKRKHKSPSLQLLISVVYMFSLTFIAAFTAVYVNDFNSNKPADPPLRDLFLDWIPQIRHAFSASEISLSIVLFIFSTILVFHENRMLILRRYFIMIGTIYFLRTLLVWSTTFPDSKGHECLPFVNVNEIQAEGGTFIYSLQVFKLRLLFAWKIVSGFGLPLIHNIDICGDYMFSGHAAHITTLCYLVREYAPSNFFTLKVVTWILNVVGAVAVLVAHENYVVDVLVGFYVSAMISKYHHAMSKLPITETNWIPGVSFIENPFYRPVENKYDSIEEIKNKCLDAIKSRLNRKIEDNVV